MIVENTNPYRSSRIDALARQFIEAGGVSHRDYLFVDPYSIGDVYHTLALIDEFRRRHCAADQKIHLICNTRCMPVAQLFRNVEKCVGMACAPYEFHLEAFAQRYPLAPGFPFVLQPDMHGRGWLGRLLQAGKITIIEAKKLLLELSLDAPLGGPRLDESARLEARARARAQGLGPNSVIIFNHAQSMVPMDPEAFRGLAAIFGENVFYDATVKGPGIIPWARPLEMPLTDIPYYAELAGNVVAIRSGIVDLLSAVDCRLVTVYPNAAMVAEFLTDKPAVAQAMKRFKLSNLGLRLDRPEHIVMLDDGDDTREVMRKTSLAFASLKAPA